MPVAAPSAEIISEISGGFVRVTRRVEVLRGDMTPLFDDIGVLDGTVSVDAGRDERRILDCTLVDDEGRMEPKPSGLWYDKIIRPWRGIQWATGAWEAPLGTFMIDQIADVTRVKRRYRWREGAVDTTTDSSVPFLLSVAVTGRDFTKKLVLSQFTFPTTFSAGTSIDAIISALAANAGVASVILPWGPTNPAPTLAIAATFDAESTRWAAIKQIVEGFAYEAFFDAYGTLIVRAFRDPATAPPVVRFKTGEDGNLASYTKSINDTELFNHVIVKGSASDNAGIFAEAEITDDESPIHKDQIGDRAFVIQSPIVGSRSEAYRMADKFLRVKSLESFEVQMGSIVFPWLEASEVVSFVDEDAPASADPESFFLSNFDVPLALGPMSLTAKRLVPVADLIPPPAIAVYDVSTYDSGDVYGP